MNKEERELNQIMFEDVECCTCGAHTGVYICRDDNGWFYRCNDCDLPVKDTYHSNQTRRTRYVDEYED